MSCTLQGSRTLCFINQLYICGFIWSVLYCTLDEWHVCCSSSENDCAAYCDRVKVQLVTRHHTETPSRAAQCLCQGNSGRQLNPQICWTCVYDHFFEYWNLHFISRHRGARNIDFSGYIADFRIPSLDFYFELLFYNKLRYLRIISFLKYHSLSSAS
jgi:hypothetical protein